MTSISAVSLRVALVVASLLAFSGCGGEEPVVVEKNPRTITKDAFAEMAELDSVRIIGTVRPADGQARIDVRTDRDGSCAGSLALERGRVQFVHTAEDQTWIKGDRDFWLAELASPQAADRAIKRLGSAWATVATDPVDFDAYCAIDPLLADFKTYKDGGAGRLSKGEVELLGESQTIPVRLKGGGQQSTIWVSVAEPFRVVKIVSRDSMRPVNVTFEEFDVPVDAAAPSEDDVVELGAYDDRARASKKR